LTERRGEVIRLATRDYDRAARTLKIIDSKNRKSRLLPVPHGIARDLDAWLDMRPECDHDRLFCSRQASPLGPKAIYRMMDRLSEAAGIDGKHLHPHMLRHTAATMALRSSGDLLATQQLLGHSDPSVTRIYCHLTTDDVRRTVATNPLSSSGTTAPPNETDGWTATDEERAWIEELDDLLAARIEEYDALLDASPDLREHWRRYWIADWCRCAVPGAERMSLRDAYRIAWEDEVVEGYSMGCHTQIARLRDVLADMAVSPRLPRDVPAWLAALRERIGSGRQAKNSQLLAARTAMLDVDVSAPASPLVRAVRLQSSLSQARATSAMSIAADLLATCALSRCHTLPVYRRAAPSEAAAAGAPRPSAGLGPVHAVAERVLSAVTSLALLADHR